VLVDGDVFEYGNALRQEFPASAVGTNKAEALAGWVRGAGLACQASALSRRGERRRCRPRGRCRPSSRRQPSNASARRSPHLQPRRGHAYQRRQRTRSTATSSSSAGVACQPRRHPFRDPPRDSCRDGRSGERRGYARHELRASQRSSRNLMVASGCSLLWAVCEQAAPRNKASSTSTSSRTRPPA